MVNYGLGVPVKVLHEAEGHIVTVEASTGETYRGTLIEAEDNMNLQVSTLLSYLKKNIFNPFLRCATSLPLIAMGAMLTCRIFIFGKK